MANSGPSISRIAGHHFSDLLNCPHRAWLNFHGDTSQQAEYPSEVLIRLSAGRHHEKDVYATLFPDSFEISTTATPAQRTAQTKEAMAKGFTYIRQAYVSTEDGVGVIDVLERVGTDPHSSTGYSYRVGEIKHSHSVRTEHVFQIAWYSHLLETVFGQRCNDGFVILADKQRVSIDLLPILDDFLLAVTRLQRLRGDTSTPPGPHLSSLCSSCPWRPVCMPQIVSQEHLSLVPAIGRNLFGSLWAAGIHSWHDLDSVDDSFLVECGAEPDVILRIRHGLERLSNSSPPYQYPLDLTQFRRSTVASLDYRSASKSTEALPCVLRLSSEGIVTVHELTWIEDRLQNESIPGLNTRQHILVYGQRDSAVLRRILRHYDLAKKVIVKDLLEILDTHLHVPLINRDLASLSTFLNLWPDQIGPPVGSERLKVLTSIRDWITSP
jgi:CRISPR/Cas system-associated exonuclease Cas4 (RecB family)